MGTTLDEGVGEGGAVAEGRWLTFPCSLIVRGDLGCQNGSELKEAFQAAKTTESSCPSQLGRSQGLPNTLVLGKNQRSGTTEFLHHRGVLQMI